MDFNSVFYLLLTLSSVYPTWVDSISLPTDTPPTNSTTPNSTTPNSTTPNSTTPSSVQGETDNEGHLAHPINPTESSTCIPTTPGNVTQERLLQQMMIDAIKQEILLTLGLRGMPSEARLNVSVQERRQMIRLYMKSLAEIPSMRQSTVRDDDEKFGANQFHSFTENGDRPPGLGNRPWIALGHKRLYFSIDIHEPHDPHRERVVKMAKLKLYKMDVRPRNLIQGETVGNAVRIEVFQLIPGNSGGHSADPPFLRRSVDSRLVSLDKASWEEFDVSTAVQDWIRNPDSNYGLEVTCDGRYRLDDLLVFVVWSQSVRDNAYLSSRLPTLNVLTQERRILSRQARSTTTSRTDPDADCVQGSGEHRCCRYPLTVPFSDIGPESWIVHPREYRVFYCAGTCPAGYRVAHRFSMMKSLLARVYPNLTLPIRCGPTRLLPLIVGHFNSDSNMMTVSTIDLLPEACVCS